ncbi:vitamin K-dependent gamma-carboxylase-like protein [Kordia periserrulae]|uniref:Vitamin K-dependent gamma-carboxylase-like protein n=1 Tax=Kordia periserrulae TaxID=701523 RepID=A0A2T6BVT6_9FLAO|nr:HTTM domain-containing protein [Kordia periserrulae]PTX60179.1 vitamin K-dependent gamma-carboxylase-like protein [Kordia periserrulae]
MNISRKTIASKIQSFFFQEDNTKGTFIAFFRIGTSVFILIHLLSIILDFTKLFGKYGIIPYDIREFILPEEMVSFTQIITFFEGYGIPESITITSLLTVFILSVIALMIGFCTRFSALTTLILYKSIYAGTYIYGIDGFVVTSLFYLVIFPSGYYLSVDNIIFKKRSRKNLNATLFKRLLQINVCLVYFFAGISKATGITWWNGEAMWKSINLWSANNVFNFDFTWLAENSYILIVLGWGVLAIEILYPVFIWSKKTRKFWLMGTLLMHIGIGVLLELYFFAAFMMFWNITAFYIDKPIDLKQLVTGFTFSKPKTKTTISQSVPLEA